MGRWPPNALGNRFIKRRRCISGGFVGWGGIVEYGPLAAKAALEQICKEKRCISNGFVRCGGVVEYGPLAAEAALE